MNQKDLNILKYTSLAGILYILPIVVAGMNYSDDFMRSADGVFGLSIMARPLADLIFKLISLNSSSNISAAPLTHILSILAMGFSVLFLAKSLNRKYNYTDALILSLVIFNPFYIQNLLYKFDSITMSLGVLIASVSVWLCSKQALSTKILSIALLVASLSLYQPCAGIFVAMVIIRCIDEVSRGISLNIKKYFTYLI
ncbi:glucosyltransferase domain-containing protein, partial [Enterobacter hormaechei]|nr:glucosyltransferase domain-containing protein [Enterobacter hormaechei]